MNFRQVRTESIKYLLEADISFLVRWYFKLLLRSRKNTQNIWFYSKCLHQDVFPKYINLRTNNKSPAAKIGRLQGMKKWLKNDMKKEYHQRDIYNVYIKVIHSELTSRLHPLEFDIVDMNTREHINNIIHKNFLNQNKKLKNLIYNKQKTLAKETNLSSFSTHKFFPKFINLSNVKFDSNETKLLEKGFKYNLRDNSNKSLEYLAIDSELALQSYSKSGHSNLNSDKHNIKNILKTKIIPSPTTVDQKIVKSIVTKSNENNLVFTRADKGNSIVALTRSEYIEKTLDFLNPKKFKIMKKDPTNSFQKIIKETINQSVSLFQNQQTHKLILMNPQIPKLYSLVKLHKDNNPIRPIVSFISAPSIKLSRALITIIQKETKFNSVYSIRNSLELIEKIKHIYLPNKSKFVSFDVQNLFPSIPPAETIKIIKELLVTNNTNPIIMNDILNCLEICLSQNYFQFNETIYKSDEGLIMGNPLSPILAEIFMNNLENKIHSNNNTKYFLYWFRYVDDIICCFKGTNRQLSLFTEFINNIHPSIKFTSEIEHNNSLNFLDLTITRNNNYHSFSIFRKPTHTDTTIHATSNHPLNQKMAAYNCMIHRLINIPMNHANFCKELNLIKQIAVNNCYSPHVIDQILRNKQRKQALSLTYPKVNYGIDTKFFSLTYVNNISEKIAKYLKTKFNYTISFKTSNNLEMFIKNNKDKTDKETKSGVYKLTCNDCPMVYIGQTGRSFNKRIKEHQKSYTSDSSFSTYANHLKEWDHTFNNNFEILHLENKSLRLTLLESLEINRYNTQNILLNEQTDVNSSPLLNFFR